MGWIVETEKKWQAALQRSTRIEAEATKIYEDLWDKILGDVKEARAIERFAGLTAHNGRQIGHVVSFPVDESSQAIGPPRRVEIALLESEHLIVASGDDVDIRFDIDLCGKPESPCLKLDGTEVSYEAASRHVLTAFLYPGFDPLDVQPPLKAHKGARRFV